ncbi:MAG: hypothetical protein JNM10_19355 [Planctomycetia bacterium]|nr:hypothetical protein [Planctomycetia bacterium]
MSPRPEPVAYEIDAADRIEIPHRTGFGAFAAENGQPGLADRVQGTPLWSHIRGTEVSAIYRALVKSCRLDRRPRAFPFRCDSPAAERHLTMRMWSPDGRRVEFSTQVEREIEREAVPLLDGTAPRDDRVISMCAWYHAVAIGPAWAPLERAVEELGLFGATPLPLISHGVCPDCVKSFARLRPG